MVTTLGLPCARNCLHVHRGLRRALRDSGPMLPVAVAHDSPLAYAVAEYHPRAARARVGMIDTPTFLEAELVTAGSVYVSTVRLPKLNPLPGALIWGSRFFVRDGAQLRYTEVHCYIVPLENMYLPRDANAGRDTRVHKP